MSLERDLNFYIIPKSVLIAEAMEDFCEATEATIPEMEDIPEELRAGVMESILADHEQIRLFAEASVRHSYRLPDEILETDIVDQTERERIAAVVQQADSFSQEITSGIDIGWGGEQRPPGYIYFLWDHPLPEASWFGTPLEGWLGSIHGMRPAHMVKGFTGFLDAVNHFEDYCNPGKGCDMFMLGRDDAGTLKSYWVKYKGEHRPRTPWDYMHKNDLPIIQDFVGRVESNIDSARAGQVRVNFD
ncbi:MAG: hypothetical protein HYV40_05625 [Candidatus Levybacteria bacterium]|nr:hypothetical protein [Candidatus Levybacteria bacterium]